MSDHYFTVEPSWFLRGYDDALTYEDVFERFVKKEVFHFDEVRKAYEFMILGGGVMKIHFVH